jgi:hypothetical protein
MIWTLYKEPGKVQKGDDKIITVYYVAPEGCKYGYASFTNQITAIKYRDEMNNMEGWQRG